MLYETKNQTEQNNRSLPSAVKPKGLSHSSRASYEIRVRDHLDTQWHAWFDGWTVTNLADGEVLITQTGVDQSALHGVLNKIRDLNLTLISVIRKEEKSPQGER